MTSSGFPMGGERRGIPTERDEARGWLLFPITSGQKTMIENNGDSLRGDEALTLSHKEERGSW